MDFAPWHYFLSLERAYIETVDFVEPTPDNFAAYSNQFASLLLSIGSEVDVIAAHLCRGIDPSLKNEDMHIKGYQKAITARFIGMPGIEIAVSGYKLNLKPWESWGAKEPKTPQWWRAYNEIKHDRIAKTKQANLGNVLNALAGLMALHLYLYRDVHLQPYAKFLEYGWPEYLVTESTKRPPGA